MHLVEAGNHTGEEAEGNATAAFFLPWSTTRDTTRQADKDTAHSSLGFVVQLGTNHSFKCLANNYPQRHQKITVMCLFAIKINYISDLPQRLVILETDWSIALCMINTSLFLNSCFFPYVLSKTQLNSFTNNHVNLTALWFPESTGFFFFPSYLKTKIFASLKQNLRQSLNSSVISLHEFP